MSNGAVASDSVATAPRERGWRWFVVAMVLMLMITAVPTWPATLALPAALLRVLFPVEQFALLVLVAIASCAVVGWSVGAKAWVVGAWVSAAGWVLWGMALPADGYGAFVRAWSLMLAASFGLVCLATRGRPFLGRSLAAVALACAVMVAGVSAQAAKDSSAFEDASRMLDAEYQRRLGESLESWKRRTESAVWQRFAARLPDAAAGADRIAASVAALAEPASSSGSLGRPVLMLAPSLLCLESLLALALGWAAYHRVSRVRIGPPLAPLRDLRFSDQLVWGLIVGATLLLLPAFSEWRTAGVNCVCFFGTLYALRGAGVLTWWVPDRLAIAGLGALLILIPFLGPVWVLAVVLATTFGLGLGDTWRDFRVGTRRPNSLP